MAVTIILSQNTRKNIKNLKYNVLQFKKMGIFSGMSALLNAFVPFLRRNRPVLRCFNSQLATVWPFVVFFYGSLPFIYSHGFLPFLCRFKKRYSTF